MKKNDAKVIWFENLNSGQLGLGAGAINEIYHVNGNNCISVIVESGEEHLVKVNEDNRGAWGDWEDWLDWLDSYEHL